MLRSNLLRAIAPSVIVTMLGFILAYQFVDPAPPKKITMGAGDEQAAYSLFGNRYRDYLLKEGVDLVVRATAGSVENLGLLNAEQASLDAAFIRGGFGKSKTPKDCMLWIVIIMSLSGSLPVVQRGGCAALCYR